MPIELLNFIVLDENFKKINDLDVKLNKWKTIVSKFTKHSKNNFALLKLNFIKEYLIIRIISSKIFPNYYLQNGKIDVQHKIIYEIILKIWQYNKNVEIKKEALPYVVIKQEEKDVLL